MTMISDWAPASDGVAARIRVPVPERNVASERSRIWPWRREVLGSTSRIWAHVCWRMSVYARVAPTSPAPKMEIVVLSLVWVILVGF